MKFDFIDNYESFLAFKPSNCPKEKWVALWVIKADPDASRYPADLTPEMIRANEKYELWADDMWLQMQIIN
jgi:hypothetical protein